MQAGRRYRIVAASLRPRDIVEADLLAEDLRVAGMDNPNRSWVIRAAIVCLIDTLHGKLPAEKLQYFIDRRARRPQRMVT